MKTWWIIKDNITHNPAILPGWLYYTDCDAIGPYWSYAEAKRVLDYWSK